MLSINPSQDEAAHLIRKVTGKQVTEFEQLTVEEQEKVIHELKNYSRNCMDLYAENFRREKIKSGKDLVYLGRVETERHYRNSDEEVKEGQAKVRGQEARATASCTYHRVTERCDTNSKTFTISKKQRFI